MNSMARSLLSPEALPADWPNHLATPAPRRDRLAPAGGVLLILVLLTLLPRLYMAGQLKTLCPDGVLYVRIAQALNRGDWSAALHDMHLNTYPAVLAAGHLIGLDWEFTGKWWNVLMGTLVVLPLFGWIRRQLDDRVAFWGCILYAFHPKLIEWCPEVIRDPTYWFLLVLTLHLLWRAVTEVRIGLYFMAGVAMSLCALTRFEGLFLLIPLAFWTVLRVIALREQRGRLALGAVVCVTAFPALLLLLNFSLLSGHTQFESLRVEPITRVQHWVMSWFSEDTSAEALPRYGTPLGFAALTWEFLDTMTRGLTPVFGVLLFIGYLGWRRTWDRRDHVPLFLFTLAICGGVWIHLWFASLASSRYASSVVLVSARCSAVGLIGCAQLLTLLAERVKLPLRAIQGMPALALSVVVVIGLVDAMHHQDISRQERAALARWVAASYGEQSHTVCTDDLSTLLAYYSGGQTLPVLFDTDSSTLLKLISEQRPHVVALSTDRISAEVIEQIVAQSPELGLELPGQESDIPVCHGVVVLRRPEVTHVVQTPRKTVAP